MKVINKLNPQSWRAVGVRIMSGRDPVMLAFLRQMAKRYETFCRRRFNKFARGGGDWKKLAPSTLAARAQKKNANGKRSVVASILIDTGLLQNALVIGAQGNLLQDMGHNTIRYGFGRAKHGKDKVTIQDIARFHNGGGSSGDNPPQRIILAQPDQSTVAGILRDEQRAITKIMLEEGARK